MKILEENNSYVNPTFTNDDDDKEANNFQKWKDIQLSKRNSLHSQTVEVVENNISYMDFDEMLPLIGEFGRYQKVLFLYMLPFAFFLVVVYFTQIFLTLIPEEYWCDVPELTNLSVQERLQLSIPVIQGSYSKCSMYDVNYTEQLLNGVTVANTSWPIVPCSQGWSYNFSQIPYNTIATDLNWVCEDATDATYAQSIFFLGAIVGGLLFGWIADKFGRIPAIIACNLLACVAGVATAFMKSFWGFAVMRFFVGFACDNCFLMMFVLALEYVGPKYRTFVSNMSLGLFFTGGACILPWIAFYVADWKLLAIVTSAPLLLVILTPWLIPESARWLVCQGDIEKSIKILQKMAKCNKKLISEETFIHFRDSCFKLRDEEQKNKSYTILDLFKTPRLRRTSLLFAAIWMSTSVVYDGHARNVGSLGWDVFVTFSIAFLTILPASILLIYTLDRVGRRWLSCVSLICSGIFSLLATLFPAGIYVGSFAIISFFFVNISYNIGLQYVAEILPTVVRGQGVSFIHIMGYVATIASPFVVLSGNISTILPLIILGSLGIVSGFLCLFLPETMDKDLPKTLQDGENFGLDQKFWYFPCFAKKI